MECLGEVGHPHVDIANAIRIERLVTSNNSSSDHQADHERKLTVWEFGFKAHLHNDGGEDHAPSVGEEQRDVAEFGSVESEEDSDHVHDTNDESKAEFSATGGFSVGGNLKSEFGEALEGIRVDESFPEHEPIANEDVTQALHEEQVQWALKVVHRIHILVYKGQDLRGCHV